MPMSIIAKNISIWICNTEHLVDVIQNGSLWTDNQPYTEICCKIWERSVAGFSIKKIDVVKKNFSQILSINYICPSTASENKTSS